MAEHGSHFDKPVNDFHRIRQNRTNLFWIKKPHYHYGLSQYITLRATGGGNFGPMWHETRRPARCAAAGWIDTSGEVLICVGTIFHYRSITRADQRSFEMLFEIEYSGVLSNLYERPAYRCLAHHLVHFG